jgi:hypothetical protein
VSCNREKGTYTKIRKYSLDLRDFDDRSIDLYTAALLAVDLALFLHPDISWSNNFVVVLFSFTQR